MTTVAEVRLWGRRVGAIALEEGEQVSSFEYDPAFRQSGIQLSPLMMPLGDRVYRFPQLSRETFLGLPGMLADSLPDRFGNAVIDAWLASQGRPAGSLNPIERLCYTGQRGMGALEFEPTIGPKQGPGTEVEVAELVRLASEILTTREQLQTSFTDSSRTEALADILRVGTSAGGARAKAVIAWNPKTGEVRSGQVEPGSGFEHWLLKFDGVSGNGDRDALDATGYGVIEYAYFRMATQAGVHMSECRLLEEGGRRHFMTRRFDRDADRKLHMQSLGALAHLDYNMARVNSYEQAFRTAQQLGLSGAEREQLFRRMVFNIVARNQDDHVKNISFLMDKSGKWSLAPAYDVTYSYKPEGQWTSSHQMSINQKRDDFTRQDLEQGAKAALLKRGRAATILEEVTEAVSCWPEIAREAGIAQDVRDGIAKAHRLNVG
ncbi:MAG: type II toxin-antitoxin system HipA family toxin [Myxococcales bacterium]|nr:type II toxin-antitoxin system HipA family toxin [Myxococcales bacterium]